MKKKDLLTLVDEWQKRQTTYEKFAEKYRNVNQRNYEKFTYKAMSTRDCWKELLTLINKIE